MSSIDSASAGSGTSPGRARLIPGSSPARNGGGSATGFEEGYVDVRRSHNPKDIGFTTLINSVIEDERLSSDGLAVLIYLLSKPSGWVIREADLRRRFRRGKDWQQKVFNELVEARYMVRQRTHGVGGRIAWEHAVYDIPQDPDFDIYGHRKGPVNPFKAVQS